MGLVLAEFNKSKELVVCDVIDGLGVLVNALI